MSRIVLSYRREDTAASAGRLYDHLAMTFGADQVFIDIDTIAPGSDFVEAIDQAIAKADVLLAVIGRTWLTSTDRSGGRKLDDSRDFVRLEIGGALKRGIRVVPVLVDDAEIPLEAELPEDLRSLVRHQAIEIRNERFHQDVGNLVHSLQKALQTDPNRELALRPGPVRFSTPAETVADGAAGDNLHLTNARVTQQLTSTPAAAAASLTSHSAMWWWQLHQALVAFVYWVMAIPMWYARERIGGVTGPILFFIALAVLILASILRLHLRFTSRWNPVELHTVFRHERRWIVGADALFTLSLIASGLLVGDARMSLAVLLVSAGIGTCVVALFIEPATFRAALAAASDPSTP
jgi:TIR domain-containing protein